jgi:GNAT superfamily N-acetyltransferase
MITKKRVGNLLLLQFFGSGCGTRLVGHLSGVFLSRTSFHVTNIFVEPEWRNQSIATSLLQRLVQEMKKNKVCVITLDDCSDTGRCYTKFGFYYLEKGYPEMQLNL